MPNSPDTPDAIAEYVIALLETGNFVSTYKHAVLLALIDLCAEKHVAFGSGDVQIVTTRELANRVIELYWRQTRPVVLGSADRAARVLNQNNQGPEARRRLGGGIVADIHDFREHWERERGAKRPSCPSRRGDDDGFDALADKVEWKLIEMPLPKLEGRESRRRLFEIGWDDATSRPSAASVQRYQKGEPSSFDNAIRLTPAARDAFVRFRGLLRPYVQLHWASKVGKLNGLEVDELHTALFGCERVSLAVVRKPLVELQGNRCFYCGGSLGHAEPHVDHFLPWASTNDDSLFNLVVADKRCNESKSAWLAAPEHLDRWVVRLERDATHLDAIAAATKWNAGAARVRGLAATLYERASTGTLWSRPGTFEPIDPSLIRPLVARLRGNSPAPG
jgi:hypothetical protein